MGVDGRSVPDAVHQFNVYVTTLAYGQLVIQVMTVRPYTVADPYPLLDCNQTLWANAIIRVWPSVNQAMWPPLLVIGRDGLESFHKRCSTVKG